MKIKQQGFSLVELMIAMVLGLLVLGGVIGVFIANQATSRANMALSELQNTARLSFQLMSQDIRNAGFSGCNNSPWAANIIAIDGVRPAWADWRNGSGIFGMAAPAPAINGLAPKNDTQALRVMFAAGNSNSISNYDGSTFILNANSVVDAGEIAIACDENAASIFQVTTAVGDTITHALGGLNADTNLGFISPWVPGTAPTRGFTNNAMLMRFESIAWFVAPSQDDGAVHSLYRASLIGDTQVSEEVLFGVDDMQMAFLNGVTMNFETAAEVTAGNNWGRIIAVNVTVQLDDAVMRGLEVPDNVRNISFLVSLRNRLGGNGAQVIF
ncbi:prepilin-type N-terminal cleavage/methylation domain-containing protein [Arsukibacterium sp.]|uniref:PilW family protein n=1 Tax=Arsukibacterium sp. TaxID=1977258 RepID=UPI001BD5A9F5|nr:prepilin-type N-terminal cleavage/methylation domain-containing protein [Arsukibacterium sp.]